MPCSIWGVLKREDLRRRGNGRGFLLRELGFALVDEFVDRRIDVDRDVRVLLEDIDLLPEMADGDREELDRAEEVVERDVRTLAGEVLGSDLGAFLERFRGLKRAALTPGRDGVGFHF